MFFRLVGYTLSPIVSKENHDGIEQFLSMFIGCLPSARWQLDDDSLDGEEVVSISQQGFIQAFLDLEIERQRKRRQIWHEKYGLTLGDDKFRMHGTLHFRTEESQMFIHIHYDEWRSAKIQNEERLGNSVCVELSVNSKTSEVESSLRRFVEAFFQSYPFCYGFGCLSDEFASKNIDSKGGGERVVGLDFSKYLPGLYWANYFGNDLRPKPDTSIQLDGFDVSKIETGTLLVSRQPPWHWREQSYRKAGSQAVRTIGEKWFFDRNSTWPIELAEQLFH
jgi:hypothetical protein